jgi:hypothetical protein
MNYGKLHQVVPKMVMVLSDNNVVPTQSETCSDFLAHSKVSLRSILSELSTVRLSLMDFWG